MCERKRETKGENLMIDKYTYICTLPHLLKRLFNSFLFGLCFVKWYINLRGLFYVKYIFVEEQ